MYRISTDSSPNMRSNPDLEDERKAQPAFAIKECYSDSTLGNALDFSTPRHPNLSRSHSTLASTLNATRPVEIPEPVLQALETRQLDIDHHGVVSWRDDSITHPRHWPMPRKLYDTAIICILEFLTTLISNTGSSAARYASKDVGVETELSIFCFVTLYLLGQSVGGLIFPPIAETFGGRTIYVAATGAFAISCMLMGASPTLPAVIIGRTLSGVFSALPTIVAVGSIENMWNSKGRIWVIQIWVVVAIFALALGPPIAVYISETTAGWRWIYAGAAICMGIMTVSCFFMKESRPALVLRQHVRAIEKETGYDGLSLDEEFGLPTMREFARTNLILPVKLWFTELLVFLVALMAAVSFGFIYLFAEALHVVYHSGFGMDEKSSSLTFLAIGVGVWFTFIPRLYDVHITNVEARRKQPLEPEAKLLGYYIAAPVLAVGLWWFACTVPPLVPDLSIWVSMCALVLVGYGIVEFDSVLCAYLTDTYTSYAESANAPVAFLRAVLSGVFPLFAPKMFKGLGANNALFLLAAIATAFCGIAILFKFYAKSIRERSPFAQKTAMTAI
ncbi:Major facilitator superfamily multidrug transporter mdrA [Fulvia fulva]|uniref:Major facilitator superfamily multidrug transporter mdrA n=1 Tax=Passalora fulva TaxID=5499 RepID=A0A9Q8UUT2_PASFU|nr:Major facilitator superfamily multidrug transporter mdrA [Fulvia fulva]KAK4611802.1 Major facilitator superfamily multidrug transporter mdrA [Fulvia fulva]KAK4613065.1 Major facilitator superfamily multidrug transporter mdrA [Fulvia fulva]UJO23304.1 Major facilitator superfamily multidrug transporter mdrA [Fulvia fulva]WPV21393.1 Major facilitator superfamily multidrug transporter mdrA [Fulvia fulva]WPV36140.1 Major facilitator superfamily multidrug transporter mdrA [Fulvia fulva]